MRSERAPELDGLRGLAVVLVVVAHVSNDLSLFGGMVGVTVFFVLSGFLITRNLLREHDRSGRIDMRAFVVRRAARLVPALTLTVLVGVTLVAATADPWASALPRAAGWFVLPLANAAFVNGIDLGPFEHFWSLAVEEQFYLVWPVVLLLLLPRLRGSSVPVLVGSVALVAIAWRIIANLTVPSAWATHGLDTSAYALLLGAAVATVRHRTSFEVPSTVGLAALAATVALTIGPSITLFTPADVGVWIEPVSALLTTVVLFAAPAGLGVLRVGVLRWFGTISYGLYLWHFLLLTLAPGGQPTSGPARIAVAAASVGVAALSWYGVERPIQRAVHAAPTLRPSVS